jgi:hypothetical protein
MVEEFKSCHNHNHLTSSPDDDSMFKSTLSRQPVPIDGLLKMRPTEREGDDDEFFSLHNPINKKDDEPKNSLIDKKFSLPDEKSPEKIEILARGGGLAPNLSGPMVPLLTFDS